MIELDEKLVKEAFGLIRRRTAGEQRQPVLSTLVRSRKKKNLLELSGKIQFSEGFDHKNLREMNADYD